MQAARNLNQSLLQGRIGASPFLGSKGPVDCSCRRRSDGVHLVLSLVLVRQRLHGRHYSDLDECKCCWVWVLTVCVHEEVRGRTGQQRNNCVGCEATRQRIQWDEYALGRMMTSQFNQ